MKLLEYGILSDEEIELKLLAKNDGDVIKGFCPEYKFQIVMRDTSTAIGHIHVRIGEDEKIINYIGHIGYGVDDKYRGNKYAAKACRIVRKVYKDHLMNRVIITCNPDNYASRKTCEIIGARLLEIVDIPITSNAYAPNEPKKCRYEWII